MRDISMTTRLRLLCVVSTLACRAQVQPPAASELQKVTASQVVTALEGTYGVHPGERRNHAKGTCAAGTFVGAADMAKYTRSAIFSGDPVEIVARFSLA